MLTKDGVKLLKGGLGPNDKTAQVPSRSQLQYNRAMSHSNIADMTQ